VAITFGRVPHPAYHNRLIAKVEGVGSDNLGRRSVKGVVWHRMLGSLWETDRYFRDASVGALTDYGIGVRSIDGAANDGVILRWNDPHGYQSGWANGTVIAPYGDGLRFIQKYGPEVHNRYQVSIEIAGQYETALTEKSRESIAALTAYFADQYGIPWDRFPIAPNDGFSFVRWHQEFTGPQEKACPGRVVIRETNELIERTRTIMREHQSAPATHPSNQTSGFASPVTYEWLAPEEAANGLDRKIGRTRVFYLPLVYTAVTQTDRLQTSSDDAPVVGPPIEAGVTFRADYVYRSQDRSWVLTPAGTRVRAADLLPKVQISRNGTITVRRTANGQPEIIRVEAG
jgi:hypothetical protein